MLHCRIVIFKKFALLDPLISILDPPLIRASSALVDVVYLEEPRAFQLVEAEPNQEMINPHLEKK
jgi:hypothetical protein